MTAREHATYTLRCGKPEFAFSVPDGAALVVGRAGHGADVEIAAMTLARRHVRVSNVAGVCWIEELDARGPVTVNDCVLRGRTRLEVGDTVTLVGGLSFVVDVARDDQPKQ